MVRHLCPACQTRIPEDRQVDFWQGRGRCPECTGGWKFPADVTQPPRFLTPEGNAPVRRPDYTVTAPTLAPVKPVKAPAPVKAVQAKAPAPVKPVKATPAQPVKAPVPVAETPETAPPAPDLPVLPYAGTSGWSGSATSRERAERADADGTTEDRQGRVVSLLRRAGETGLTWSEIGMTTGWHHGTASGALSALHKRGHIARLTQRRNKSSIYVHPEFIAGRETAAQGRKPSPVLTVLRAWLDVLEDGLSRADADPEGFTRAVQTAYRE